MQRGDCLTCSKIANCTETSVDKVLASYTCPLFDPVPREVYAARVYAMQKFGERVAVKAMTVGPPPRKEEEDTTDE